MVAGVSLAVGAVETILLQAISGGPFRAIGSIIADVTVEEAHNDTATATKNPVEVGAAITDHVFINPAELVIHAGWSDSGNYDGYVQDVYAALLQLQAARQLLNVYTGKRAYSNMLLLGVATVTSDQTEFSLMVVARLEQAIIVQTSSTTLPAVANQANPASTAPPANAGTQQTTPPTSQQQSMLSSMTGITAP
jgi:hypothetical protein